MEFDHSHAHASNPSPRNPTSRSNNYPYTAAYLREAAARSGSNTITFAEAFPAPTSLPCHIGPAAPDQLLERGELRLDYSCGGRKRGRHGDWDDELDGRHHDYGHGNEHDNINDEGDEEEEEEEEEEDGNGAGFAYSHGHERDGMEKESNGGGDNDDDDTEKCSSGVKKKKRKAVRDRETGAKKRDKGKGKATGEYPWGSSVFPAGYKPASVEDVLDVDVTGLCGYSQRGTEVDEW
ncbi:hypothetical protein VTJ49DRAFT_4473 [Mycothermus thermophilus]|uniref:Uncharacterized protein n=1 Tax=Humicola insolens TaxID=85995 RepID=A0ABR3VLC8_HUMIN